MAEGALSSASSSQQATAQYNVWKETDNLVGMTVAQVRQHYSHWNIAPDAVAINLATKAQLDADYVLETGDRIEFVKDFGEKGGDHDALKERMKLWGPHRIEKDDEDGLLVLHLGPNGEPLRRVLYQRGEGPPPAALN